MAANEKSNDIFWIQTPTTEKDETQKQRELENELLDASQKQKTTDCGAFLHIVKSSLGAGVLAMPYAFKNAGFMFGIVATCFVAIIVTHTTALLVDCSQSLRSKFNKVHMSYADTIEHAFIYAYGEKKKNFAKKSRHIVDLFLFITYYGTLSYYVLLIASTFKEVIDKYTNTALDIRVYTLSIFVLIFPVGSIRRFKYLVPFSAIANFLLMIALSLILWEVFRDLPPIQSRSAVQPLKQWPVFFSLVFFGSEGIGTILPLENEMKHPNHLTHSPRLLYLGMTFTMSLNLIMGFFGYWKYGSNVKGVISLNLPDDWLSETIKLTIALVVLFTYGLLMTTPMEAIWNKIRPYIKENNITSYYYALRTLLILGNALIATALPSLAGIIGLIGALGLSMLGVFIPAFIDLLCLSKEDPGCMRWKRVKNLFLLMFAVFFAIVGIYSSVLEMISG